MTRLPPLSDLLREGKLTATLAVPLVIGQLSQILMNVADTLMVAKLGVTELAALTLAGAIFSVPFVFAIGLTISISILSSAAVGKGDDETARNTCRNGFILSLGLGLALFALSYFLLPLLPYLKQPEEVIAITPPYLTLILASLVPAIGAMALKGHSDSLGRTWTGFYIFLGGVLLNIVLNFLFIFALDYGLPGAGWATLLSRIAILAAMVTWFLKDRSISHLTPRHWWRKPDGPTVALLTRLGIPSSLHLLAEIGAFSFAGLLIGLWGEAALASQQVALTVTYVVFMIPLGLSMALTMRMGNTLGAGEAHRHSAIALSGYALTLFFTALMGSICVFAGRPIASWFVETEDVIAMAAKFLVVVGIFQIVDGIQIASAGMLRGLEDVKVPAWCAFIAYWVIGLPIGWLIATRSGLGPVGVWWGLALGLLMASLALSRRVFLKVA